MNRVGVPEACRLRNCLCFWLWWRVERRRFLGQLYQIVPRLSLLSTLSVLSCCKINNLRVINMPSEFDFHTPPPDQKNTRSKEEGRPTLCENRKG